MESITRQELEKINGSEKKDFLLIKVFTKRDFIKVHIIN
jgi:hypothetical protein